MNINISGRKVFVSDHLQEHIRASVEQLAAKFFARSTEGTVTLSQEGQRIRVDCTLHAGHGVNLQSHAEAEESAPAFELAAARLEKQLRRYKRRIKNHHNASLREASPSVPAQSYVMTDGAEGDGDHKDSDEGAPVIIAEKITELPVASVSNAVMLLDLGNAPALMFRNSKTGGMNMVYRRNDGNIGWIEPTSE